MNSIRHQKTASWTPQQKGIAESMNQRSWMCHCILIESGKSKWWWAEAIQTASQLQNKCISSARKEKIPEKLWTGRESKTNYLRVFGCRALCVAESQRRKLDAKKKVYIMIGYPEDTKRYHVRDPERHELFLTLNAVYEEDVFPMRARVTKGKNAKS